MVSKSQIKLITSLSQKKYRQQHGLFVVEGVKGISEFLNSDYRLHSLFTEPDYFRDVEGRVISNDSSLKKISFLKTPQHALAVFYIPENIRAESEGFKLVLDDIRDPGNLGTIIRLCDWFGIKQLICSPQTVDCYNPKVVQATMGSLTRVTTVYTDLTDFLNQNELPTFGAFMDGEPVYKSTLPEEAILVLGNEGRGISAPVEKLLKNRITIPQFGKATTESLNVATAGAILLSEFRRRL